MEETVWQRLNHIPLYKLATILLLVFVFSFTFKTDLSFDQDLGRHIKSGEIIVETGQVNKTNQFSYTYPNFPFINHHWLFQVIVFGVYQTIGIQLFLLVKIGILLLAVFIILKIVPNDEQVLLLPVGFIFLHALRGRTELRPEVFSFLFTSIVLWILFRFYHEGIRNKRYVIRFIYFLPLIQLIWVNTHIYFALGLIIQAIFISGLVLKRDFVKVKILSVIFILSLLVCFINPNGFKGLLYPFQIFSGYGYSIAENQNMFFLESIDFRDPNFLWVKLAGLIVILGTIVSFIRKRFDFVVSGIAALGLGLALLNIRSFPYLVFLSLPMTMINLGSFKKNSAWVVLNLAVATLLLLESWFYLNGDYYRFNDSSANFELNSRQSAEKGVDFLIENNLPQPIFNNFDIGSYIEYRTFPRYKTFVDGRPEAYPKEFFQQVYIPMQEDPKQFANYASKNGFKTVIFSSTDQTPWANKFFQEMVKNPEWKPVYLDDFIAIFVKSSELEKLNLKSLDLAKLSPDSYNFDNDLAYLRISMFLLNTGFADSSHSFAQKSLDLFPDSPNANRLMVNLLGNNPQAYAYMQKTNNPFWW